MNRGLVTIGLIQLGFVALALAAGSVDDDNMIKLVGGLWGYTWIPSGIAAGIIYFRSRRQKKNLESKAALR